MTHAEILTAAREIAGRHPDGCMYDPQLTFDIAAELIRLHDGAAWSSDLPAEEAEYWWTDGTRQYQEIGVASENDAGVIDEWYTPDGDNNPYSIRRDRAGGFWLRAEPADSATVAELRQENERLKAELESSNVKANAYGLMAFESNQILGAKPGERLREAAARVSAELADCQRRLADAERAFDRRLAEVTAERDAAMSKLGSIYTLEKLP